MEVKIPPDDEGNPSHRTKIHRSTREDPRIAAGRADDKMAEVRKVKRKKREKKKKSRVKVRANLE